MCNSFREINLSDISWLYSNISLNSTEYAAGFWRHFNGENRAADPEEYIKLCIYSVKEFQSEIRDDFAEQNLFSAFVERSKSSGTVAIFDEFRDFWRGFTNEALTAESTKITEELTEYSSKVENHLRCNYNAIIRYRRRNSDSKVASLFQSRGRLLEARKTIRSMLAKNPIATAETKLVQATKYRRHWTIFKDYIYFGELLGIEGLLKHNDPNIVDFPLRFMNHISARVYTNMLAEWDEGISRNELITKLYSQLEESGETLLTLLSETLAIYDGYKLKLGTNTFSGAYEELKVCIENELYCAAALIIHSVIEGTITELAEYLNPDKMRIFHEKENGRRFAYVWDSRKGKHLSKKNNIGSLKSLLYNTRMATLFHEELYDYLVMESYQVRCGIMHGRLNDKDMRIETIAGILCNRECASNISKVLDTY